MRADTAPAQGIAVVEARDPTSTDHQARTRSAINLLRQWRDAGEADEAEQRSTWNYLRRALDEDRLSDRKLFP